jgi:alpha-L-arabinofuranosidase
MRYDGSMVNKCPDAHLYKWKEMIGPRDLRKPYHGTFNPYATHGFAIFDFLNLCEAAGFLPIPGVRIDETPEDMADFVEYVNGPVDSPWGKKRAADGHPAPYNLKHIEIGNEERFDTYYCQRFELLGEAIWSKDPDITLLIAHNLGRASDWVVGPNGETGEPLTLAARLVQFAKKRGGKIWWDCHYNFAPDGIRTADHPDSRIAAVRNLRESIRKLVPDYDLQIAPLEENGQNHNMERALGHAHNHNTFARMGDWLPAIAVANTLQADQQEIIWSQGRTFYSSSRVWFQPPYYVDQMIAQNWASNVVKTDYASPQDALDALAKTTDDGKALILQVVNLEPTAIETAVALDGFKPSRPTATVTQIAGALESENTLAEPEKIVPRCREWDHKAKDGSMTYTFPPYSFTIIRFE